MNTDAVGKVGSLLQLRELAPDLPFIPVLQGWSVPGDYDACHERYTRAGIDLTREPVVDSAVCRRQATSAIALLARHFAGLGCGCTGSGFTYPSESCRDLVRACVKGGWRAWLRQ